MFDLKPCPFCGGKAEIFRGTTYGLHYLYEPRCIKCECALGLFDTEEQAVEAWNTRADSVQDKSHQLTRKKKV